MYPPAIETEVFARIPDRYQIRGRNSPWIENHRGGQPTDCFLEGPSFDRAGNLHVVDVAWGRVFRISDAGEVDLLAEYDGEPNGLKIHRDGHIVIADFRQGILTLDPDSGAVSPLLDRAEIPDFKGVNDLVFAENGDLFFTLVGMWRSSIQRPMLGGSARRWGAPISQSMPGAPVHCCRS